MWNSFKVTIEEPAVVQRVGKLPLLIELVTRIEDGIHFEDGSYLNARAHYSVDSSYARLRGFFFPLFLGIAVKRDQKTENDVHVSFWNRDADDRCLVMIDTNRPEDNLEGSYQEALAWTVKRVAEKTNGKAR
jgi:hypothetical protein